MFDLGKLTDVMSSWLGATAGQAAGGVLQQLDGLGINPAVLEGLDAGQIGDLLARHGMDLSALDQTQIAELAEQLGGGSELAAGLGDWISQHIPRS